MGAGYTGVARRGHALQDLGSSLAQLEDVTTPCPDCGKPATLETYESSGQTKGLIKCSSYRHSRRFGAIKGCPPKRLTEEELEKLMALRRDKKPRLTELEREEIHQGIASANLSIRKLNDLAGLSKNRLAAALSGSVGLNPDELEKIRAVIFERKLALTTEADAAHEEKVKAKSDHYNPTETKDEEAPCLFRMIGDLRSQIQGNADLAGFLYDRIGALEMRVESFTQSQAQPLSAADLQSTMNQQDPDLIRSFLNFERVCRQMRAKCPHLYQATVRRASEVAF